jgi:hypothetical protein
MLVQFSWLLSQPSEQTKWILVIILVGIAAVYLGYDHKRLK